MSWLTESREWLMFLAEWIIVYILILEYQYDFNKDLEKKQRRTRTTKKTTQRPGGETIIEESTETTAPVEAQKEESK